MITASEARVLFDELLALAKRGDEILVKILETKAWIPLGYSTFFEAWPDLMGKYYTGSAYMRGALALHFATEIDPTQVKRVDMPVNLYTMRHLWWTLEAGVEVEQIRSQMFRQGWQNPEEVLDGKLHRLLNHEPELDPRGKIAHERSMERQRQEFFEKDPRGTWINPENKARFDQEKRKYRRRGGDVSYPDRPYRVTVEFTTEEVERFQRIADAKGTSVTVEAKKAIERRFAQLEETLAVSV